MNRKAHNLTAAIQERSQGMTIAELACMLAVPEIRVRHWIKLHKLPVYKIGGTTSARWPDVLTWFVAFKSPGQRRVGRSAVCESCGHGRTIPE